MRDAASDGHQSLSPPQLALLMPGSLTRKVALSFLAHPDDAEFLCTGTLIQLGALGWELHIATATAGDLGSMTENREQISARRKAEGAAAARMLGGEYHCLEELDCLFCFDKPTLQKTYELFRKVSPSLVFTHPAQDYMLDHEVVHKLARAARFIYDAPNLSTQPRTPGAGVPFLYYCDPIEGRDHSGQLVTPTTYVDISGQLDRKKELLACHESQRSWLMAHHGMDEYLESMSRHAAERGAEIGVAAAEAFIQHRGHPYPREDLLADLLAPVSKPSADRR